MITACQCLIPSAVLIGAIKELQCFTPEEAQSLYQDEGALSLVLVLKLSDTWDWGGGKAVQTRCVAKRLFPGSGGFCCHFALQLNDAQKLQSGRGPGPGFSVMAGVMCEQIQRLGLPYPDDNSSASC